MVRSASVPLSVVQAFYEALASRDPIRLSPFLSDDVEWHMVGPVDVLPFCGYRRGKAAVADYIGRLMPSTFAIRKFSPEDIVIDGDKAAMLNNITSVQKHTGRTIAYQTAVFVVFKDGKVVLAHGVADTFNMAEQLVGHRIDAYREPEMAATSDVVTV